MGRFEYTFPAGHPLADRDPRVQGSPDVIAPTDLDDASNPMRPTTLDLMVGQEKLKPLLRRLIAMAQATGNPLDHMLLVGGSGTGKTTLAMVIARELGRRVFVLKPPLDMGRLEALRQSAVDGDVVYLDEIHLQVSGDRRGLTQACDPESFYQLLEDGVLATPNGIVPFPKVTWIGSTTDVGLLPEALSNRFPLQPRLAPYTGDEIATLGTMSARRMGLRLRETVALAFAGASRGNPRQMNSYIRSASALTGGEPVDSETAREVVEDLNSTTRDGLNESMQIMLRYLYQSCRRETPDGVVYKSSVNAIATACGHGRDTKAIALLVEPYLIQRGFVQVTPQGRMLTPRGVDRARALCVRAPEALSGAQTAPEAPLATLESLNALLGRSKALLERIEVTL